MKKGRLGNSERNKYRRHYVPEAHVSRIIKTRDCETKHPQSLRLVLSPQSKSWEPPRHLGDDIKTHTHTARQRMPFFRKVSSPPGQP